MKLFEETNCRKQQAIYLATDRRSSSHESIILSISFMPVTSRDYFMTVLC